ncbi:hypothetical protein GFS24_18040 [Chitinophaga sp. SYP-B3965]|uniref:hypothetical protein n=1 Tax=Chitinophaga sp. SYP-B3965 TaxID=2663120 RepID=UPI001299D38A|nr:hypothetical protein [Chitinophaga sp. SYP-B3965]MRG47029.1 hypothetical protein [Chitinophaga sp. SYP-B3965]
MKKLTGIILLLLTIAGAQAQEIHSLNNGRDYYANKSIAGQTRDGAGPDYVLLHKSYAGVAMNDNFVMGKITAIRGTTGSYNRKWTVEVNTASAYNADLGTLVGYNESARLVLLTYNGEKYMAAEIGYGATMFNLSFTGYTRNETLILVPGDQVSNVQELSSPNDQIVLQGQTTIKNEGGPSTLTVVALAENINMGNNKTFGGGVAIKATQTGRNMSTGAALEFVLPTDMDGNNPWGQGRVMTVPGNTTNGHATGKMIIGTRRHFDKLNTGVEWYYGDDIVIDGSGNVGIGTLYPDPDAKLAVKGNVFAKKVKVTLTGWSDFVFEPGYKFPSIYETEQYIQKHKHLPGIPNETEVKEKGVDVGEMNKLLLQKIEEQMLYIIELKKQVDKMQQEMDIRKGK